MPTLLQTLTLGTAATLVGLTAFGSLEAQQGDTPAVRSEIAMQKTYNDAEILRMALDDEFKAEATYEAVLEKFGEVRPFSNIVHAERRHSQMAMNEMDRRGISYSSENPYHGQIAAPDSLLEACQAGEVAEIENIALYDRLLPSVRDPQTRQVLQLLQAASRDRHLHAFRRCIARGGMMGRGRGRGRGMGPGGGQGMGPGWN